MQQTNLQRHLVAITAAADAEIPVCIEELPSFDEVTVKIVIATGKACLGAGESATCHRWPPKDRCQPNADRRDGDGRGQR